MSRTIIQANPPTAVAPRAREDPTPDRLVLQIADATGFPGRPGARSLVERAPQNLAHLFLHGAAVLRGFDAQACFQLVVNVSNGQRGHDTSLQRALRTAKSKASVD